MKAFLVEDEPVARQSLIRLLEKHFPEIEVAGTAESVAEAVAWLSAHRPDLLFLDVQLSDGTGFDILLQTEITCPVVITTAFDEYALKAFEAGSVDYLLKPVDLPDLRRAVARCLLRSGTEDAQSLLEVMSGMEAADPAPKRILVRVGGRIYPIRMEQIVLLYAQQKGTYLYTVDQERYLINPTLDEMTARLSPRQFFRVSRSCIVARQAIRQIQPIPGGRYSLDLEPGVPFDVEVSRSRSEEFFRWSQQV